MEITLEMGIYNWVPTEFLRSEYRIESSNAMDHSVGELYFSWIEASKADRLIGV